MQRLLNPLGWSALVGARAIGLAWPALKLLPRVEVSRRRALVSSLTLAVAGFPLDFIALYGTGAVIDELQHAHPSLPEPLAFVPWSPFIALALVRFVQWLLVLRLGFRVPRERASRWAGLGVLYSFVLDVVTFVLVFPSQWFWSEWLWDWPALTGVLAD